MCAICCKFLLLSLILYSKYNDDDDDDDDFVRPAAKRIWQNVLHRDRESKNKTTNFCSHITKY